MPVLLSNGSSGYRPYTAPGRDKSAVTVADREAPDIVLGLVNNMSDAALETTVRQVLKLLDAAAQDCVVRLKLFSLPSIQRSDLGQRHLKNFHYFGLDDLGGLDGLIITGAEPRAPDLTQETYWRDLTGVFDWAERHTLSTISSCLAVHAAVFHLDGIRRHPLDRKQFGIFEFAAVAEHPLTAGVPARLRIPHSRWNEVREADLRSGGYVVLSRSDGAGVDMFVKQRTSLLVFFQGHPEYEAWTLMNEYRRDIDRFLGGEQPAYPAMPEHYFDPESAQAFARLEAQAHATRSRDVLANFSTAPVSERLVDPWRPTAARIYRNWLSYMAGRKAAQPEPMRASVSS